VLATIGGAIGASALLAACGGEKASKTTALAAVKFEQPVEIAFFHSQSGANGKALQDLVDKFNQTNDKRITVKASYQGSYPQVHEKNMVALQGGTPIEVSTAYENMVAEYMRGSACINLEDYVKDTTLGYSKESLDDIFPAYLEGLRFPQYGNQLLSFPFTKSLVVMYVNDEVLQRANVKLPSTPTWTWQEFASAVQGASRTDRSLIVDQDLGSVADPNRLRTFGWANYPSASTINAWAYSRGGSMLTADNKQVRLNEPPYLEAYQLTEDTFKRQFAYNPPRQPGSDFDFASNRYAFIHQSSTSRPFVRKVLKDNGREKMPWRIVSLPQKDPSKPATVQYGANIAVFKTTDLKQAASWLFVRWLTDRDQDVQWSITSSYMPIRKSSSEHPTLKAYWEKDDPQGKQAFDLAKTARPEPNIRGTEDVRTVMQDALQAVMEGKQSSKTALEEATRQANQLLQTAG
jgi:ABC-type glycerol-3-phosphate transport system substrate-binding protein